MQYRLYRAGVHEITGTIAQCVQHIRERNPSLSVDDDLIRTALQSYRFVTPTGLVYRIESTKTREELIHYADGMPFESAWRAYAGMVEGGECTMQDLQCIEPELYRMVESYLDTVKQISIETNILEWLATNDYEPIDDGQVSIYRCGMVDVYHDDGGVWQVVIHTNTRAILVDYSMSFTSRTPHTVVIEAIKSAIAHDVSQR